MMHVDIHFGDLESQLLVFGSRLLWKPSIAQSEKGEGHISCRFTAKSALIMFAESNW